MTISDATPASMTALKEWQLAERNPDYLLSSARVAEFETLDDADIDQPQRARAGVPRRQRPAHRRDPRRRRTAPCRRGPRSKRRLLALVGTLTASLAVAALFLFGVIGQSDGPTVTFFGNRNDGSWHANLASGLDRAARDRDMTVVDVPWVVNPGVEFRELAETGAAIIVSDGQWVSRPIPGWPADFPDTWFGVTEIDLEAPNLTTIAFANEQGAFLAGAAAALRTESGVVGFVGAQQIPTDRGVPRRVRGGRRGRRSRRRGVGRLHPAARQQHQRVRPSRQGRGPCQTALFDRDADVVFAAAGHSGFGTFEAALAYSRSSGRHVWAIGIDNDQWFEVPITQRPHVLTSVIKRGDIAMYELVNHILDDGPPGNIGTVDLADDAFGYSDEGEGLTPPMIAELDRLIDAVASR